jgi:DNA-binding NarL/FixJ family response regulator
LHKWALLSDAPQLQVDAPNDLRNREWAVDNRNSSHRTRVAIVHDSAWVRDAIHALLARSGLVQVVESCASHAALETVTASTAAVALTILDGDVGHESLLLAAIPYFAIPSVVVLADRTPETHVERARRAAFGVVRHTQSARDITDMVLLAGDFAYPITNGGFDVRWPPLSDPDRTLIRMIANGLTLSHIADLTGMTRERTQDRLVRLLDALHLSDRVQLAAYALSHGLIDEDSVV